jgi:hypothetical protein
LTPKALSSLVKNFKTDSLAAAGMQCAAAVAVVAAVAVAAAVAVVAAASGVAVDVFSEQDAASVSADSILQQLMWVREQLDQSQRHWAST